MDKQEIEELAAAVTKHLESKRSIDAETHRKHHEFIDTLIVNTEKKNQRKEKWIQLAGGWGIVLLLSGLATAVWNHIKHQITGN